MRDAITPGRASLATLRAVGEGNRLQLAPGWQQAVQASHASMATGAALRLRPMYRNLADMPAIELLAAAQAVDFCRPLRSSPRLEAAHALVRSVAGFWESDRLMAPDIAAVSALVRAGRFSALIGEF